ncbi:T9SS type A sorting domain-containing protein [bacterium]|nr:T9SS type A sorting domain-containing protein [bacterium]
MTRTTRLLFLAMLLIIVTANAEPRPWTFSNLDPNGGGTVINDPSGSPLTGTFRVHIVYDAEGDGPDPVIESGPDIGKPGDDDELVLFATQTAPTQYWNPPGVFTVFVTFDPVLDPLPEDGQYYVRVFEDMDLELGTRYVNSVVFPMPDFAHSAQTVVEFPRRMAGYIGNGSPNVFVTPSEPTVAAGETLTLNVQISDDEPGTVSVPALDLPGGPQSVLIDDENENNVLVRWAVPLTAVGDHTVEVLVHDGDLYTSTLIPVTVNSPELRPSAFQPIAPVNGGTAWEEGVTTWQASIHPQQLDITYTFYWSETEEFSDPDSVEGLTEPGVILYYQDGSTPQAVGGSELVALTRTQTRALDNAGVSQRNVKGVSAQSIESFAGDTNRRTRNTIQSDGLLALDDAARSDSDRKHAFGNDPVDPFDGETRTVDNTPVYTDIEVGDTYYWVVRAVATDGTQRYSAIQSAIAERPDLPQPFDLLDPADDATVSTLEPVFRWRAALDPDINDTLRYDLIWSPDGGTTSDTVFAIPDTVFDMTGEDLDFDGAARFRKWLIVEAQRQNERRSMDTTPAPPGGIGNERIAVTARATHGKKSTGNKLSASVGPRAESTVETGRSATRQRAMDGGELTQTASRLSVTPVNEVPVIDDVPDNAQILWYVEVVDATQNRVASTSMNTFTVDAPNLPSGFDAVAPAHETIVYDQCDVTLSWTASSDADAGEDVSYDVLATTNPVLTDPDDFDIYAAGISDTSFVLPSGDEDDVPWKWTVRAMAGGDTTWMHNGVQQLFVTHMDQPAEFELTSPENDGLTPYTQPTLEWTEAVDTDLFDAVSYTVYWSRDNWANSDSVAAIDTTTFDLDIGLADNDVVWWNVRAVDTNTDGRWANESGFHFTVHIDDPPTPFTLVSPDSGTVIEAPQFYVTWQPSEDPDLAGPVTYTVEFAQDLNFTDPMEFDAGEDTTAGIQAGLLDVGDWWWRVVAEDATQMTTQSTQTWSVYNSYSYVAEWDTGVPTEFAIARSYPNPFNPVLTVVMASPKPGANVRLTVHNILGREVAHASWRPVAAGYKPVSFDMTGHSSGPYFIQMHADNQLIATQRVTFLK